MLLLNFWRYYKFLASTTKDLIEKNDSEFSTLWARRLRLLQCAELFVNRAFPGDYFFNKTKILSPCMRTPLLISKARRIFFSNKLDCFIHSYDDLAYQDINTSLEAAGFSRIDSMLVFSADQDTRVASEDKTDYDQNLPQLIAIGQDSISMWVDVFCKAFNAEYWKQQIHSLTMANLRFFRLFVLMTRSDSASVPAACALLFCYKKVMGLYCLGTLPKFRRKGLASLILKSSISMARAKRMKLFFVQAFLNDGFADMYKKVGLNLEYRKGVYVSYRGLD
jgi:GNAT superfamily N-acetyltransferase